MKVIKLTAVIAVLALGTTSCVENTGKYKTLLAERDSLQTQVSTLGASYDETIGILNDVENGFAEIRQAEGQLISNFTTIEGQSQTKKQQVATQINQVKAIIAKNKERIEQLQRSLSQSNKQNSTLAGTIQRMETELAEKVAFIESLQGELANKNVKIEELTTTVSDLNANLLEVNETSAQQQTVIEALDTDLNTAWYCIATAKELKANKIVTGNGLFRAKTIMDQNFDKEDFTQVDLRKISSIPTGDTKVKVLTSHPKESYALVVGEDKTINIEISDPANFWSVSKYLVVQK